MSNTLTPPAPQSIKPEVEAIELPQSGEWLTIAEVEERYQGEWVVLIDVKDGDDGNTAGGRVFAHGTDREKVYDCGPLPQPVNAFSFYVGEVPEDMWLML